MSCFKKIKNIIYYVPETVADNINTAGPKAREDIDSILKSCGLEPLLPIEYGLLSYKNNRFRIDYWRFLFSLCNIKNRWIVLQYPVYSGRIEKKIIDRLIHNNHLIFFIHDLEYLRFKNTKSRLQYEIDLLNKASIIVSHNSYMTKRLQQDGVTVPILELQLFDYLLSTPVPGHSYKFGRQIAYAGNLGIIALKNAFLLNETIQDLPVDFLLYGPGFDKNLLKWSNIKYSGSYSPTEIPHKLEGSFGLIWDGNSVTTCDGQAGEYMRYNNPHKLSLYIVAGLPVIVWKESAIAKFVRTFNIGITVDSLADISEEIQKTGVEEYNQMLHNIQDLQMKISSGFFTKNVLQAIDDIITEQYDH